MTTGKGLYKWVKEQEKVRWPRFGRGMIVYFTYNGIQCAGFVSKTFSGKRLIKTDLTIRPMQASHDIGSGAGEAIFKTFCKEITKP